MIPVNEFKGLYNTGDEQSFPIGAMTVASQIMVNNYADVIARPGINKIFNGTNITASYGTLDTSAMYLVDNGTLYRMDTVLTALAEGFGASPYQWCEESARKVFVIGEGVCLAINDFANIQNLNIPVPVGITAQIGAGSLPVGEIVISAQFIDANGTAGAPASPTRLSIPANSSIMVSVPNPNGLIVKVLAALPDDLGWVSLGTTQSFLVINSFAIEGQPIDGVYVDTMAPPLTNIRAAEFYNGRLVLAEEVPEGTAIFFSKPGFYHLFSTVRDFFILPDVVTDIANIGGQLLITGRGGVYVLTPDNQLQTLANYGAPIGKPILRLPEGGALIWTDRGVCSFPNFTNLTNDHVSVTAGTACATSLFEHKGSRYMLCSNDGIGRPFNSN